MTLSAQLSEEGGELKITIEGRFDFNIHTDFRNAYRDISPQTRFIIDLSQTTFMDSSAIGMLLLLREYAGGKSADIRLVDCSPDICKVLAISNLDKMFVLE
jgi:anti-anti-sigma factor